MAKAPSTKPYCAVSAADGDDDVDHHQNDDYNDDDDGAGTTVATQSLDLQLVQNQNEALQKERSIRYKFLASACLLAALVFGGREYYIRNNGEDGSMAENGFGDFTLSGVRGSSHDAGSSNDLEIAEELFEGANDSPDGMVLDLVEGDYDDDSLGGELLFEGDLDDEINNGEIGGDFDSDMDDENSEGDSDPFASSDEDLTEVESTESQAEELGEGKMTEEEIPEGKVLEEELPDYFVPLAPAEREQMKEKLRSTLRTTKNALLVSANVQGGPEDGKDGLINTSSQRTLVLHSDSPKQFMHMHHMKTGGTSMDGIISCALRRQKVLHNGTSLNYSSLSECGSRVRTCMNDLAKQLNASVVDNVFYRNDAQGQPQVDTQFSFDPADEALDFHTDDLNVCKTSEANVMSYCASLHAVRTFGWKGVDKITVIRNPVDRAWSMYRFSLNRCYKCEELKDVLRRVENGTFTRVGKVGDSVSQNFAYSPNDSCAVQMLGHQATNLLSSVELYNVANDVRFPREKEIVEEAVRNLREEFTWIGITDRIQESVDGMRTVFPFLAENLNEAADTLKNVFSKSGEQIDNGRFSLPDGYNDDKGCPFEHRNAGMDPLCGTKELDEETITLIKKLNNRDMAVYKAAVERFELQLEVLSEYRTGSL